jgi:hypothetical protein
MGRRMGPNRTRPVVHRTSASSARSLLRRVAVRPGLGDDAAARAGGAGPSRGAILPDAGSARPRRRVVQCASISAPDAGCARRRGPTGSAAIATCCPGPRLRVGLRAGGTVRVSPGRWGRSAGGHRVGPEVVERCPEARQWAAPSYRARLSGGAFVRSLRYRTRGPGVASLLCRGHKPCRHRGRDVDRVAANGVGKVPAPRGWSLVCISIRVRTPEPPVSVCPRNRVRPAFGRALPRRVGRQAERTSPASAESPVSILVRSCPQAARFPCVGYEDRHESGIRPRRGEQVNLASILLRHPGAGLLLPAGRPVHVGGLRRSLRDRVVRPSRGELAKLAPILLRPPATRRQPPANNQPPLATREPPAPGAGGPAPWVGCEDRCEIRLRALLGANDRISRRSCRVRAERSGLQGTRHDRSGTRTVAVRSPGPSGPTRIARPPAVGMAGEKRCHCKMGCVPARRTRNQ